MPELTAPIVPPLAPLRSPHLPRMAGFSFGDDGQSAVMIEVNDNHLYMAGKAGVLDFRLTNPGREPVEVLNIAITCDLLKVKTMAQFPLDLRPGRPRQVMFQVEPLKEGECAFSLTLSYELNNQPFVFSIDPRQIAVMAESATPQNVVYHIDKSIHAGEGAKVGFGMQIREEVKDAVERGSIRTVNDLLDRKFNDQWMVLELFEESRATDRLRDERSRSVRIVPRLRERLTSMSRARLIVGESPGRSMLLLGMGKLRLGRSREVSDVLLRLLPRSPENDPRTLKISGRHLMLELRAQGLVLIAAATQAGTKLNGLAMQGERLLALNRVHEVEVAEELKLRLTAHRDESGVVAAASGSGGRYAALGPADDAWRQAGALGIRSVVIERMNNLASEERYVLVYRSALIGGEGGEIPAGNPAGEPLGRIVRMGGGFWVEGLEDAGRLSVDGHPVKRGWVSPLSPGMTLTVDQTPLSCATWEQVGI